MQRAEPIRSLANPLLKRARAVVRGEEEGVVALEGERLVGDAMTAGFEVEVLLVAEGVGAEELAERAGSVREVERGALGKVSGLTHSPGVLGLCRVPAARLGGGVEALATVEEPDALVVVAAGVQDPGNLGAIARVAEAAGARALAVTAGGCRPWNPKALRGSMGSLLRMLTVEVGEPGAAWDGLGGLGFRPVVARTRGGATPNSFDWSGRVALWLSPESGAWPRELEERAAGVDGVTIPMAGGVESLNVAVAAGVLLFAAGRTGAAGGDA